MERLEKIGGYIARYGLALNLLWIGIFKFTPTEAKAIQPLLEHSPFMNWMLIYMGLQASSNFIGIFEILTALAISLRPISAKIAYFGSLAGVLTFILTLSFLFTTPDMFKEIDGLWVANGFVLKDIILLGFCVWSAAEAYNALKAKNKLEHSAIKS